MNILLLGSSGFIGSFFKRELLTDSSISVVAIDKNSDKFTHPQYEFFNINLLETAEAVSIMDNYSFDVVINCAARTDLNSNEFSDYKENFEIPRLIVEYFRNKSNITFIHFSSMLKNAPPGEVSHAYGASKLVGDNIFIDSNISNRCIIIELPSVWGPFMKAPYLNFFFAVIKKRYLISNCFSGRKSFLYVRNLYSLVYYLIHHQHHFSYIVASDFVLSSNEFALRIAYQTGTPLSSVSSLFVYLLAYIGSFLKLFGIAFPINLFRVSNMKNGKVIKATDFGKLNVYSTGLDTGIRESLDYIKSIRSGI